MPPPGHITFFSRKNGAIPWVGHKCSVIPPWDGRSYVGDNPGVGHARRVMSRPIPGGAWSTTDLKHTLLAYHLTHPNFERHLRENEKSYGGAVFAIR